MATWGAETSAGVTAQQPTSLPSLAPTPQQNPRTVAP